MGHMDAARMVGCRKLAIQDLTQRRSRLDRHDLACAVNKLQRQPARARSHLDDPLEVVRQPADHARMKALRTDEPVIELWLEPVQELPGQGHVGSRVTRPAGEKPSRLVLGEHANIRRGVARSQFATATQERLRRDH